MAVKELSGKAVEEKRESTEKAAWSASIGVGIGHAKYPGPIERKSDL
jgi:hypothetical protein